MEDWEEHRLALGKIKKTGQRMISLGKVPEGGEATVACYGADRVLRISSVTVAGTCQMYEKDGVITTEGRRLFADQPCLV